MATIIIEASKVIEAAERMIAHVRGYRLMRDEDRIAKRMKRRVLTWRGARYPTREEAIQYLDENTIMGWRDCYGYEDLAHAKRLLVLAKHGDSVTLNDRDAMVLFGNDY